MDLQLVKAVQKKMGEKSTEELLQIYNSGNTSEFSLEAFEAIRQILIIRGVTELKPLPQVSQSKTICPPRQPVTFRIFCTVTMILVALIAVQIWRWATSRELFSIHGDNPFLSVAFTPNGERIVSTAFRDHITLDLVETSLVTVWDSFKGQRLYSIETDAAVATCASFSPDGEWLAVAADRVEDQVTRQKTAIKIYRASTSLEFLKIPGNASSIARSLAFSPDGKQLVTGGKDGIVRMWDSVTGKELLQLPNQGCWINSVAINTTGKQLATRTNAGTVKLWQVDTGQELSTLNMDEIPYEYEFSVQNVTFSSKGNLLAASILNIHEFTSRIIVWDIASGKTVLQIAGKYVAFSHDGSRLAAADGCQVKIYQVASGKEVITLRGHERDISCVAFSPDGKRLASASHDKTIKVWNISE